MLNVIKKLDFKAMNSISLLGFVTVFAESENCLPRRSIIHVMSLVQYIIFNCLKNTARFRSNFNSDVYVYYMLCYETLDSYVL